jgi:hypothetical protein
VHDVELVKLNGIIFQHHAIANDETGIYHIRWVTCRVCPSWTMLIKTEKDGSVAPAVQDEALGKLTLHSKIHLN